MSLINKKLLQVVLFDTEQCCSWDIISGSICFSLLANTL